MHYYMKGVDVVDIVDLCWVIICCVKPLIYHTGYKLGLTPSTSTGIANTVSVGYRDGYRNIF